MGKHRKHSSWNIWFQITWHIYSAMLGVSDSFKVKEWIYCKDVISLGVYAWSVEGIT